jgi:hypothetical protein
MTRQHFKALADALASERPGDSWDANKKIQWMQDCKAVASVCKHFNPGFKPDRFYTACGGMFGKELASMVGL